MTDEQRAPRRHDDGVTEGGDPVCWLEQVCDECGAMREDRSAAACARCGTPFPCPGGAAAVTPVREPHADSAGGDRTGADGAGA
ncbi:hypothetical protein [Actinacidiphila acidipaludis]|uniref:Small CPxCG-related zinc finger protein n=1 Tax=Actinacidiphila acidipaludis TaxID=2873382 RepID=A0ABS7QDI5_9ACTN|nr:hypothetical protein [Streptomyces acidipaludis]MBY8881231.1 hypothetical protein [Streptomyces acidipaludis]